MADETPTIPEGMDPAAFAELQRNMGIANELEQKRAELVQKRADLEANLAESAAQKLKQESEILRTIQNQSQAIATLLEEQKQGVKLSEADAKAIQNSRDLIKGKVEQLKAVNQQAAQQLINQQGIANIINDEVTLSKEHVVKIKEANSALDEQSAVVLDILSSRKDELSISSGIAEKLGITANIERTRLGTIVQIMGQLSSDRGMDRFKLMAADAATVINPLNLVANIFERMVDNALELDKVTKSLAGVTGAANDFTKAIMGTFQANIKSGVSMQDAGNAMQAITNNISSFNPAAENMNQHIAENVALLQKMGASVDVTTGMIDVFTRALSMSQEEAVKLTREITLAGQAVGISAAKMANDFAAVQSKLVAFGNSTSKVFIQLQAQAKETGIGISDLISISEGFDTFNDATSKAGKLNALLGTNIRATTLIQKTNHADRLAYLREELRMTVGNMSQLDIYTQKLIAQQIAGGDLEKATRLINMSTQEFLGYEDEMEQRKSTQEELAEATAKIVPVMQQLQLAFAQLAANEAVISMLKVMTSVVGFLAENLKLVIGLGAPIVLFYEIYTASLAANAATSIFATNAQNRLNMAQAIGFKRIGLMVTALGALYAILHKTGSPMLYMIPAAMAQGVFLLGQALNTFTAKAIIAVVALALLAAAFSLIFHSLASLVDSFGSLIGVMLEAGPMLPVMALSMYALGGALIFLGASGAIAAAGIVMSLAGLAAMFALMKVSGIELRDMDLGAIGEGFMNIGTGLTSYVAALKEVASIATELDGSVGEGFLAASVEGGKTSVVFSGNPGVLTTMSSDRLTVDVNIPEISIPRPVVNVYLNGNVVKGVVEKVVMEKIR